MALMDYGYNDPERVKEREEKAKKHEKWLNEDLQLKIKDSQEYKILYIKRKDIIDLINSTGVLNDLRESCDQTNLRNMRF